MNARTRRPMANSARSPANRLIVAAVMVSSEHVAPHEKRIGDQQRAQSPHAQQYDTESHRHPFVWRGLPCVVVGERQGADEKIFPGGPVGTDARKDRAA